MPQVLMRVNAITCRLRTVSMWHWKLKNSFANDFFGKYGSGVWRPGISSAAWVADEGLEISLRYRLPIRVFFLRVPFGSFGMNSPTSLSTAVLRLHNKLAV
ncbi:uncharacterized protein ColSpa_05855 [Colletotrichum spaethianum]|uniref:Uncharacterized protein n=1 Tax=Colletotrichum spaethianum TaxID=700344 RepID=A0AA37LFX9_9PEZI|nr:uncharacterized protein ColSpa_05855 [Colletotrichum spaethianum]GKT45674.1 hypothetical protein ColSpa_05855 [Colletotrichum spaethianum]